MYNCRHLDGGIEVLRTDYRITCSTAEHGMFMAVAAVVITLFSFGIPMYLGILMVRRMGEYDASNDSDRFVARRVAESSSLATWRRRSFSLR